MLQTISNWLANPKRSYKEGLDIFQQLATDTQKKNFLQFLQAGAEKEPTQFSSHFSILINQVVFIQKRIRLNPEALKQAATNLPNSGKSENSKPSQPDAPNATTNLNQLPEELSVPVARLKEMVPIMARIHAEMANEKLADDKRAELRRQLIHLDDERRKIWTIIDQFQQDHQISVVDKSEEEKALDKNMIQVGIEVTNRITLVQQNIKRNTTSYNRYKKEGKTSQAESAKKRIEQYEAELKELQDLLNE